MLRMPVPLHPECMDPKKPVCEDCYNKYLHQVHIEQMSEEASSENEFIFINQIS